MMHGAMATFLKLYKAKNIRHKNQKKKKKKKKAERQITGVSKQEKGFSAYEYDIIPIYLKTKWHL